MGCKDNKITNLKSMRCVNNTIIRRLDNTRVIDKDNDLLNMAKNISFLGEGKYGEVFKACYPDKKNKSGKSMCKYNLAIKKIKSKIPEKILNNVNKNMDELFKYDSKYMDLKEVTTMFLGSTLVLENKTQNLPMLYGYTVSEKEIKFLSEYANGGSFKDWLLGKIRSRAELDNAFFQIFHGLYCLAKYFGVSHNDLHWENVLIHKVKPGGLWVYEINDVKYYLPNLGFVFVLWDFGFSERKKNNIVEDLKRISYSLKWANDEGKKYEDEFYYYDNIKKIILEGGKKASAESIFSELFKAFKKRPKGEKTISKFTS